MGRSIGILASEHLIHDRSSRGRFPSSFLPCASSFPLTSPASVKCQDLLDVVAVEFAQEANKAFGTFSNDLGSFLMGCKSDSYVVVTSRIPGGGSPDTYLLQIVRYSVRNGKQAYARRM